jgi:hypothetical protein
MAKKVQINHPRDVTAHDEWVSRKPQADKAAEPMKRLTIDVPESLHTRIKISCVTNKQKMADVVRELLAQHWPEAA